MPTPPKSRLIWGALAVAAAGIAVGVSSVGTHHTHEVATAPTTVEPQKAIVGPQYFPGIMHVARIMSVPSPEPTHFVAELPDGQVGEVDTLTGRVVRNLIPADTSLWILSSDNNIFYYQVLVKTLASCPSKVCAVNLTTGATTPVKPFRWGDTTPSQNGTPISPDGTHAASTNFDQSPASFGHAPPTVTIATATGNPMTYHLPAEDQVDADPTWSPNGTYLQVGEIPGITGKRYSAPILLNVRTGALTTLHEPSAAGCWMQGGGFSETEYFIGETCGAVGRILPFQLSSGAAETPIPNPPGTKYGTDLEIDNTGQNLITTTMDNGPGAAGPVWTEQNGTWTRIPNIRAVYAAWG